MTFELPTLPYKHDALEPHISRETLEYHYGKHHQTYVTKLNDLLKDHSLEFLTLDEIIAKTAADGGPVFNNAAQIWNHTFYWHSLVPGGSTPDKDVMQLLVENFGSLEQFQEEFTNKAISLFGSGWTWLVKTAENKLEIINTTNAETPAAMPGVTPLMTCDVWEHAYYIDYRNARPKYLTAFWELVNWDFVKENLLSA